MRVILLKDVEKVGKKFDVKDVKDGYAKNFLIAQGLAKPATKETVKWAEVQREIESKKAEEELKRFQEMASSLDSQELVIEVKVGDQDQLFESVNSQKIAEKLKEKGFDIKKSQVDVEEPIKELGEYPVKIKFEHNLEVEVRVIVVSKEKEKAEEEE